MGVKNVEWSTFNATAEYSLNSPKTNSFLDTCVASYHGHVPLILSPEDIWLVVLQAVTKHIGLFPEDARKALVNFEGQKELVVVANHLAKGDPANNWGSVFNQFSDQLETHLGKKRDLFDYNGSTTGVIEKAAIQVQMMAALASYFRYTTMTLCGIPSITLLGTVDDWKGILDRTDALAEFYSQWAHEPLRYVVGHFYDAANGNADVTFWQNFVKQTGMSGGPRITGFINAFFPYLEDKPNRLLHDKPARLTTPKYTTGDLFVDNIMNGSDVSQSKFAASMTSVPMKWDYYGSIYPMKLVSGIFGTQVYNANGINGYKPLIGVVIGEDSGKVADKVVVDDYRK